MHRVLQEGRIMGFNHQFELTIRLVVYATELYLPCILEDRLKISIRSTVSSARWLYLGNSMQQGDWACC